MLKLEREEKKARDILIEVAKGNPNDRTLGRITYKDLWDRVDGSYWGRHRVKTVVGWITKVSAFEAEHNRPPLNEIVVPKGRREPTEPWIKVKRHIERTYHVSLEYGSHAAAQTACWRYWSEQKRQSRNKSTEDRIEEGVRQDREVTFRKRNSAIIDRRKKLDGFTCKACGFCLEIDGKYVIDCHHIHPLNLSSDVRVTSLEDLMCLCPTCHRIAHTRLYPLSLQEIRAILPMERL